MRKCALDVNEFHYSYVKAQMGSLCISTARWQTHRFKFLWSMFIPTRSTISIQLYMLSSLGLCQISCAEGSALQCSSFCSGFMLESPHKFCAFTYIARLHHNSRRLYALHIARCIHDIVRLHSRMDCTACATCT